MNFEISSWKVHPFTCGLLLTIICFQAFYIRLYAVLNYGRVIHEFDPWFNFRSTQYLVDNGYEKFLTWFDDKSWYPLGRPVGTTVYPGIMLTAASIYQSLQALGIDVSLNDICVFIPAVFACFTCLIIYLFTYEVSKSSTASLIAAGLMSVLPAHLMRSVAGGFDNESVALPAMCCTFYLWIRCFRTPQSWPFSFLCATSYIYMVSTWGGYTFVINMIGLHAVVLTVLGRFSNHLHHAYSIVYILGTLGAIQFPVVGMQPLQSMEQMGPLIVFFILQVFQLAEICRKLIKVSDDDFFAFRFLLCGGFIIIGAIVAKQTLPEGFLGPVSARVRGLFLQHTKTGNPLVDSVAEHQTTPTSLYIDYFHVVCYLAPFGFFSSFYKPTDGKYFLLLWCAVSFYFSRKMIRLVLLLSPGACAAGGIGLVMTLEWCLIVFTIDEEQTNTNLDIISNKKKQSGKVKEQKKQVKEKKKKVEEQKQQFKHTRWSPLPPPTKEEIAKKPGMFQLMATVMMFISTLGILAYIAHCQGIAKYLSQPQIIVRRRGEDGNIVVLDDFREAYWWLRDNTPEDSRIMAWWDYGYQINGVANRTTIADGNTWNHEHIALLGKALVSSEEIGHGIARHLADYVLVWSTRFGGFWGDDLAKMPHIAKIAGSVYHDVPQTGYRISKDGTPSALMNNSLLYLLHSYRLDPDVREPLYFDEAYTSTNDMVRIYKVKDVSEESKLFCADKKNRNLDGSGNYPPGLQSILAERQDFKQHPL